MYHLPPRPGLMLGVPHCEECLENAATTTVFLADGPSGPEDYVTCHACATAAQAETPTVVLMPFDCRN